MIINKKSIVAAAIVITLILVPTSAAALTTPPAPRECAQSEQVQAAKGICVVLNYARTIHAEINAFAARLTGQEAKTAKLEERVAAQDKKIANLEAKLTALDQKVRDLSTTPNRCNGYPAQWCDPPRGTVIDSWGFANRESVSYVAYKVAVSGRYVPYGMGNAKDWPAKARSLGIPTDSTPRVGDAAVWSAGVYGHVMYVEEVLNGGANVRVGQFNADMTGVYSEAIVPVTGLTFIHF